MIFEDENELGYWMGDSKAHKPAHGGWPGGGDPSSLIVCNSLLSPEERDDIEDAAYHADLGNEEKAEEHRAYAGYSWAHIASDPR